MQISDLWKKRILSFEERGNDFTYNEIAEMASVSRGNVSVVIRKMINENPDVVSKIEDSEDNKIRFRFNYDILRDDVKDIAEEPELPEWIARQTYDNIIEALGLSENMKLSVRQMDWIAKFQRGGIAADVYENGQKVPEYTAGVRIDNCIVLSWGKLS